ncbi:MAG: LysM peptidoglycan-binding domain-containing protein [Burkholderiaceae bacterium]
MKKSITRVAALALGIALSQGVLASTVKLSPTAPDSYTVVKGDTLWDISGRFLQKPWRWPEIWEGNKASIKDPHWIYPGDVIYLDRSGANPKLRVGKQLSSGSNGNTGQKVVLNGRYSGKNETGKLQPMVRSMPLDADAIPTINTAAIDAFLNKPLIVDEKGLQTNPRVVATQEGRVYLGRGDKAYVRGIEDESVTEWHIYRQARPLLDPDTRRPIAYEALYVGSARLEKLGDPSTMRVFNTSEEVGVGDRLMPAERARMLTVVPRAPDKDVSGRIVTVYRGVSQVGKNSVVAINRGSADGLDVGHVLSVKLLGRDVFDSYSRQWVKLPDESVGHMMIFRAFDKIAYGLVMEASKSISVGDTVTQPE